MSPAPSHLTSCRPWAVRGLRGGRAALLGLVAWLALAFTTTTVLAQEGFVVRDIRLEGLQRISAGTVFNYLPLEVGETVDPGRTAEAIRALYRTGFFRDVRIERDGDTLVVFMVERPSIASIEFDGNRDVKTDDLLKSLEPVGFAVGRIFNRSIFDQVEQELRRTYFAAGKYGVRIQSTVTPLERNRVAVRFDVSEGRAARIRQINVVGNQVFSDRQIARLIRLRPTGMFSWVTRADRYSRERLAADLESLRSYYLDRGYINFDIDSTQVSISPDKQEIYITINITEGEQYRVGEVRLAGDLIVPEGELFERVEVNAGEVFSRRRLTETSAAIAGRLGEDGYAFANVNAVPDIDDEQRLVTLTFFVDPGQRVYVRRIDFTGNEKTRDEVLRREMRQLEGAWISTGAVERSKERLQRLGYFQEVNVETPAVPGTTDQVDVEVSVTEMPSGNLLVGAGFAQTQGLVFQTSISQDNVFGTGNRASFSFSNSRIDRNFEFAWFNPYWTLDGVSRGFDLYQRRLEASRANLADYDTEELGGGITFGIPITEFNSIDIGANIEKTKFRPGFEASQEVLDFREAVGPSYFTLTLSSAFSNDSRDSAIMPTRGQHTRLRGEMAVPGGDLKFYRLTLRHQRLLPLFGDFIFVTDGELGYGDGYGGTDGLPLTQHFFAGGIRSVRGFEANTLGPRDSRSRPLGGSFKTTLQSELIIPTGFGDGEGITGLRLAAFFDIGNVFADPGDFAVGELRASGGIAATWFSPLGPMSASVGLPIKKRTGDKTQPFQFTFGTAF
jgi:outer membrane protein insertion porin family